MPSSNEIRRAKDILRRALILLIKNDSELIQDESILGKGNRKLHEVCINHRFALYIENLIKGHSTELENMYVDIEFNRRDNSQKILQHFNSVRPDIIVHNRESNNNAKNILVIEAKKDSKNRRDHKKLISFINDENYRYMFGFAIVYKKLTTETTNGTLFYKDANEQIVQEHFINGEWRN